MKKALITLFLCFAISAQAEIADIPKRDFIKIKFLFDYLVNEHDFGYTIFGTKPMSLADINIGPPTHVPFPTKIKALYFRKKLKNSIAAWDKHKNQFNSQDFIILDSEDGFFNCITFYVIHKNNLLNTLRNNQWLFQEELGDSFTPESLVEKLEKREATLAEAIHTNDKLLGIMLGYGVRNATLFQERLDVKRAIAKKKESSPFLTQKLNAVEAQIDDFSEFEEEPVIPPLYFLADISHPETIELKEKYEMERQEIIKLKQTSDIIELTLQKLSQ